MSNENNAGQQGQGHEPKELTIVVNGRQREVEQRELTFEQLVGIAFPDSPVDPNAFFTITYRRGSGEKPEGTLVAGESVRIKEGMIFNVTQTVRS